MRSRPKLASSDRRISVLESFGPPHGMTNPYLTQLFGSFPDSVEPVYFGWQNALAGRFDVFHLHWPENLLRGSGPLRSFGKGMMFLVLLLRIRFGRRGLVRTRHNLEPHERPNRFQRALIELSDSWTDVWISLSDAIETPAGKPRAVIPIGHYLDWVEPPDGVVRVPGRLLHFGHLRGYKGIGSLLQAFSELRDEDLRLAIVGKTRSDELAAELVSAAEADPRVVVTDDYVPEDRLAREILEAELVVLPFARITNSSSILLALSLGRPVLVPAAPAMVELAEEVGSQWVITYSGQLTGAAIDSALGMVREHRDVDSRPPALGLRDWDRIGQLHAEAFTRALEAHGRNGGSGP